MAFQDPYLNHNFIGTFVDDAAATAWVLANRWDSTQDGLGVPVDGIWYYNSTTNVFVGRMNGAWVPITGSVAITGNGEIYVDAVDGSDATGDGSIGKPYQTFAYACTQQAPPATIDEFLQPITFILAPGVYESAGMVTIPERMHITVTGDNCRITAPAIMWGINPVLWNTFGLATDKDAPVLRFVRKPSVGWEPGLQVPDANYPQGFRLSAGLIQAYNSNPGSGFVMPDVHILEINGVVRESIYIFNDASGSAVEADATKRMKLYLKDSPAQDAVWGLTSWICGQVDTKDDPGGWLVDNRVDIYAMRSSVFMCGVCRINWMEDCEYCADYNRDILGNPYPYGRIDGGFGELRGAAVHRSKMAQDSYFGMGPAPAPPAIYHTVCNAIVFDESSLVDMATVCPDLGGASFVGFTVDADGAFGRGWWNGEYEYRSIHSYVHIPCKSSLSGFPVTDEDTAGWRLFTHTYSCASNWLVSGQPLSAVNMLTITLSEGAYVLDTSFELDEEFVSIVGDGSGVVLESGGVVRSPSTLIVILDTLELGWDQNYGRMESIGLSKMAATPGTQSCLWMRQDSAGSVFKDMYFGVAFAGTPYAVVVDPAGPGTCSAAFDNCHTDLEGLVYGGSATGLYNRCTAGGYSFGASKEVDAGAVFNGVAIDCVAGSYSFGVAINGGAAVCGGILQRCVVPNNYAFGVGKIGTGASTSAECSATLSDCAVLAYGYGQCDTGAGLFNGNAKDCTGSSYCFGSSGLGAATYAGRAYRCTAGSSSFGSATAGAGTFSSAGGYAEDCVATEKSFGYSQSSNGIFVGEAVRCTGTRYCFGCTAGATGVQLGSCTGTLVDCEATEHSFGSCSAAGDSALCSATLTNCTGVTTCFGAGSGVNGSTFSGVATECIATSEAFGYASAGVSVCSGTVTRCISGANSYASGYGDASCSGTFVDCTAGSNAFGYASNGTSLCSGTFKRCVAGGFAYGVTGNGMDNVGGDATFSGVAEDCSSGDLVGVSFSFGGASNPVNNTVTATVSGTLKQCSASGDYGFGVATAGDVAITSAAYLEDCVANDGSFGYSVLNSTLVEGMFRRCRGGDKCFGVTHDNTSTYTGDFSGQAEDCIAGDYAFGSCSRTGTRAVFGSVAGASAKRCEAGVRSFGSGGAAVVGTCTGEFISCVGGEESWGSRVGGVGGLSGSTLTRCSRSTRTAGDVWDIGSGCKLLDCNADTTVDGVTINIYDDTTPPVFYQCTVVNGSVVTETISDPTGGGMDIKMAHCRMNMDIGATVTNLIVDNYNVVDPLIEVI